MMRLLTASICVLTTLLQLRFMINAHWEALQAADPGDGM